MSDKWNRTDRARVFQVAIGVVVFFASLLLSRRYVGGNSDIAVLTVPVLSGHAGAYEYNSDKNPSSILIPEASQTSWVCASAYTMTRNSVVLEIKGALPVKYAPLECRLNLEDYAK